MKKAVIGIGSNSVRMLVGDIRDGELIRLRRERAGTRLFAGLDQNGCLSAEAMALTAAAVTEMATHARAEGITEVDLFATSATRDAANADRFALMLSRMADLRLHICAGEEEAMLSFLGATEGERSGVLDIGGGSTEVVIGQGTTLDVAFSCQMGAVRLFRQYPINKQEDMATVIHAADEILCRKLSEQPKEPDIPALWVGVGGTFTTLAAMVRGTPWTDRTYMHGTRITRQDAWAHATELADMPLEKRLEHPGLQPNRADIVVHGICILLACMDRLGIDAITVSEYGNLDGWMKMHG